MDSGHAPVERAGEHIPSSWSQGSSVVSAAQDTLKVCCTQQSLQIGEFQQVSGYNPYESPGPKGDRVPFVPDIYLPPLSW